MSDHADTIREKAETLAGLMSIGPLTPDESEVGMNVVFDLLAENQRLRDALEATANMDCHGYYSFVAIRNSARAALAAVRVEDE